MALKASSLCGVRILAIGGRTFATRKAWIGCSTCRQFSCSRAAQSQQDTPVNSSSVSINRAADRTRTVGDLLQDLTKAGFRERVETLGLLWNTDFMLKDKTLFTKAVADGMCEHFVWSNLTELLRDRNALKMLNQNYSCGLTAIAKKSFSIMLAMKHVPSGHILDWMALYGSIAKPSHALFNLVKQSRLNLAEHVSQLNVNSQVRMARGKVNPYTSSPCSVLMSFLVALHHSSFSTRSNPVVLHLVVAIYDKVAEGLVQFHPETRNHVRLFCTFLTAMRDLSVHHKQCLAASAQCVEHLIERNVLPTVELTMCLHSLSIMRHPADSLFKIVASRFQGEWRACSRLRTCCDFCWAFVQQGLTPPPAAMEQFCLLLTQHMSRRDPVPAAMTSELMQLLAHLPPSFDSLDTPLRQSALARFDFPRAVGAGLQARIPLLSCNVLTETGLVVAAGLYQMSREAFVEWPAIFLGSRLKATSVHSLSAQPVALLVVPYLHVFVEPKGAAMGIVSLQQKMLEQAGWAVTMFHLSELEELQEQGVDIIAKCCEAMAVVARRRVTQNRSTGKLVTRIAKPSVSGAGSKS